MAIERTDAILEFDESLQVFDLVLGEDGDLKKDKDLYTSLAISILADRRSLNDDEVPNSRGWSGDAIKREDEENIGSRLWLLRSRKTTQETLNLIDEFAREATQWYINKGIAERIDYEVFYQDKVRGIAVLILKMYRPQGNIEKRFDFTWEQFD